VEIDMAVEQPRESGGNGMLYFIVGALVVGVAVLAWMMFGQVQKPSTTEDALGRAADSIGDAAESVGDAARDATRNVTPPPAPAPAPQPAPAPAPTPQ
jgi:hypothetical protein